MTFANPEVLYLLLLVPILLLLLWFVRRRNRELMARLGNRRLIQMLTSGIGVRNRKRKDYLRILGLAFLILSLARPQWGTEIREIDQEGLQVIVALDVSQSMLVEDVKPNRLERAKLEIADLMSQLEGDEIGIVLFSGASFLQVPLTSDYVTALNYLESAHPEVISRPGTVIGDAIRTAQRSFDPNLPNQKVLIIMTDGEDHETDPLAAAKEAASEDIKIYSIGFGTTDGEPIPEIDRNGNLIGYKIDKDGNTVISKLDLETLRSIADIGHGKSYHASASGSELRDLLAEINTLQKANLQNRVEARLIERFQYFLLVGLITLVAAELLPEDFRVKNGKKERDSSFAFYKTKQHQNPLDPGRLT